MLSEIQRAIDNFLVASQLKSVSDLIFIPQDDAVVVRRFAGRKGTVIDVSSAASPSEVIDIIKHHSCVY